MKQVRNMVFETNSSSTHSITLTGLKDYYDIPTHTLNIEFGEYGWEQERYYSVRSKLSYVFTMIQYKIFYYEPTDEKDLYFEITNSKYAKWIREMVKDFCEQEIEINKNYSTYYPCGYIDHQSTDILDDFWSDDENEFKKNMKEFIFNSKYGFVTDNDNH
jgi:DNA polymerase sigma